jgi:hypothetical protein
MAYAALDYYRLGRVIQAGTSQAPDRSTIEGKLLRDYIWKRLIDTFLSGNVASTTLELMAILKFIPTQFGGGAPELLRRTKAEWPKLKSHLDAGSPWPIALVGTTDNPSSNHQVLAYGYEDHGNGTGLIYIYDDAAALPSNVEHKITIDLTRAELATCESAHAGTGGFDTRRGPLKAIFCSEYWPDTPPIGLGLERGMTASPAGFVDTTTPVQLQFTAKNYGYGPTPPLQLDSKGVDFGQPPNSHDAGQEQIPPTPIASESDRSWAASVTLGQTAAGRRYFSVAHLGTFDGVDVWKNIPSKEGGTSAFVDLASYASVLGGIWFVNANGGLGTLDIKSVDPVGRVSGTIFNDSMVGFWNEASRCLTMVRISQQTDPSLWQVFLGFLSQTQGTQHFSLAGTFQAFTGTGATARRDLFGWIGEQPVIG